MGGRQGLPRWQHRTGLFQPRAPAFWAYATLLAVTGVAALREQGLLHSLAPGSWTLAWALLVLYLLPMFLLIYLLDVYEREPLSLVVGALAWGAVAATTLAAPANAAWGTVLARLAGPDFAARWAAALTAPWVEETVKVAGVVLLYLIATDEFDDIMDGFVYGAMVGLGFAVVEDVLYFVATPGGGLGGVVAGFFVRVVASGLYGHVLYSGLTGMAVACFGARRANGSSARRLAMVAALFLVAVAAHSFWNSPWADLFPTRPRLLPVAVAQVLLAAAVKGLPFLALLVAMVILARRREAAWLQTAIGAEIGGPWLLPGELEVLLSTQRRRHARGYLRRHSGRQAAALLGRLQREQINLAMVRSRVQGDDHPDLARQRQLCITLRNAVLAFPGATLPAPERSRPRPPRRARPTAP